MPLLNPDRRHIIVRGRLWRDANPGLPEEERERLVSQFMDAGRGARTSRTSKDKAAEDAAPRAVEEARVALWECGPVWWGDGVPDLNRKMAHNGALKSSRSSPRPSPRASA